jgi:hypothetical protein
MTTCVIKSVGIAAPGFAGWAASLDVLRGAAPYVHTAELPREPALLPPNERRRATVTVRQAFRAAEDAMSPGDRHRAAVFASSDADLAVSHRICAALAANPRVVSPTDFHNSVHNAASGYWSIATQSMALTTTLSAYDASFAAGLIEAVALAHERDGDVLLVAYDTIAPQPLLAKRPLELAASVALVLSATATAGTGAMARVEVGLAGHGETTCANAAIEPLRGANPALRALPLLELLAARRAGAVTLRGAGGTYVTLSCAPWT